MSDPSRPDFDRAFEGFSGAKGNGDGHDGDDATIRRLADMRPLDYERAREAEAELLGCRVILLDRLVRAARGDGAATGQKRPLNLPPPEPWPEAADGNVLLDDLAAHFTRHLILPNGAATVMALWSLHCHCFDAFSFTPRLQFKAATKGAGKSTAIELLKGVVPKALETETITQAFLFRVIELAQPTVLLDEADTYLREDEELRGLVNAGVKPGAMAGRCVGDNQEPRLFSCHAPVALAGIGALPPTIEDRALRIVMKRRLRTETIEPIEDAARALASELQRKAARWARDHAAELREARPDMRPLINRAADRWRALYAIAEAAAGVWPGQVRDAQAAITAAGDDDADALGEMLLADVRKVFQAAFDETADRERPTDELSTKAIVGRLLDMQDRPWPEMGRTRSPLTTNRFTREIGKFGVQRRRAYDAVTQKMGDWGYRLIDFAEAFERYLDA
jgi:hypothetical protein